MANPNLELYFEHTKSQAQFAYFQLGLTASAIAFAVHETDGHSLIDTPWLIGVAVALWGSSFAIGCFGLDARQRGMLTNLQYLEVTKDVPRVNADPALVAVMTKAKGIVQTDIDRPLPRFRRQLHLLFLGAVAYVGGHIMDMASTPSAAQNAQAAALTHSPPAKAR